MVREKFSLERVLGRGISGSEQEEGRFSWMIPFGIVLAQVGGLVALTIYVNSCSNRGEGKGWEFQRRIGYAERIPYEVNKQNERDYSE